MKTLFRERVCYRNGRIYSVDQGPTSAYECDRRGRHTSGAFDTRAGAKITRVVRRGIDTGRQRGHALYPKARYVIPSQHANENSQFWRQLFRVHVAHREERNAVTPTHCHTRTLQTHHHTTLTTLSRFTFKTWAKPLRNWATAVRPLRFLNIVLARKVNIQ